MKKRSVLMILLITILSIGMLVSCSSSSSGEPHYSDQDFIKSVSKGLEARWKLQESQEDSSATESMREAVQTELSAVEEYKSATFEDSVLQEKALKYINVLNDCLENVEYYNATTGWEKWDEVYNERTIIIKDFVDNYGLKVSDKYQSSLDELVANGKTAGAQAAQKEQIEKLVNSLEFELKENDYGWKTYEATLENTTDYDITTLSLDISLLDAEGVIVETTYADVDNVSKGQKARVEFSTESDFDKIEPIVNYFEAK